MYASLFHPLVDVKDPLAVRTAVLHVFAGLEAEGNAAAGATPQKAESSTYEPGHESRCVLSVGYHSLLAVRAQSLSWDVLQDRRHHCCGEDWGLGLDHN